MEELFETVELMNSSSYKDRFVAEYWQNKIRYDKLQNMVNNWDNLKFTCPLSIYLLQLEYMKKYIAILEMRAVAEGIVL
jgi:hypothetical protein